MAGTEFGALLLLLALVGCCLASLGHPALSAHNAKTKPDGKRHASDTTGQERRTLHTRLVGAENGDVALAGTGDGESTGRVEIYYDGVWGTVCDDDFGDHSASVVCRSLGYEGGVARSRAHFGEGRGRIWLDDVICSGDESNLAECSHSVWGDSNCGHSEDVGVECSGAVERDEDGDVRLADDGRVEIFYNREWGTVCDDLFNTNAARVVCSSLGFNYGLVSPGSAGTGHIWLDDVTCTGTEASLDQCTHSSIGVHDCGHDEDVAVTCFSLGESDREGSVRLRDGPNDSSGRLEIYHDDQWGTVCDDDFDDREANVVCRMLGYSHGEAEFISDFERGTGPIWLDELECTGSEQTLSDCEHPGWGVENCHHMEDAGLTCY